MTASAIGSLGSPLGSGFSPQAVAAAIAVIGALACVGSIHAAGPISASALERSLIAGGYPARSQCGVTLTPPSSRHATWTRAVPACWVVVEHADYSLYVVPYATKRMARQALAQTRNPAATAKQEAVVGAVVLSAYRLPVAQWARISKLVEAAVASAHP
jgi:hypothetical protein